MMKRKRLPDARCHTVQERHTSFVTSATSTCALCHTKTASRLLIENENIWKHHVQVPVPFQVNVLSVHYPNIKSMVMCWKFQSFFFFSGNHTSIVVMHMFLQDCVISLSSCRLRVPLRSSTAVPYPHCDTPIKFMCMFRTVHWLKTMQTSSSRCLGHTWLIDV